MIYSVVVRLFLLISIVLGFYSADSKSEVVTVPLSSFGKVIDNEDDGIFDEVNSTNAISIRHFDGRFSEKAFMNFDISSVRGRKLVSAKLHTVVNGYANNTSSVLVMALSNDLIVDVEDASRDALLVGEYNPLAIGLNATQVDLDTATLQALVNSKSNLTLRLESPIHATNTQLNATKTQLLLTFESTSNSKLVSEQPISEALFLDENADGIFDTINQEPTYLSIRTFDSFNEVSVSCYDTRKVFGKTITAVNLIGTELSFTSNSANISILGFSGEPKIDESHGIDEGALVGELDPISIGLSEFDIELGIEVVSRAILANKAFCIRFQGQVYGTNVLLGKKPTLNILLVKK
jgi:hypothetical protein